tara:strand:+ start:1097 stop:1774 length:678 start_codon:yes stop_codon:yes gene_type:complete
MLIEEQKEELVDMTWQNILKMKNPVFGSMMEPLQFNSQMKYKLQRMCRAGKEHLVKKLEPFNKTVKVHSMQLDEKRDTNLLSFCTAHAYLNDYEMDAMYGDVPFPSEFKGVVKRIKEVFNESIRICQDAKSAKTEAGRKEEYIKLIKDVVEGTDRRSKLDLLNEKFAYDDFEKYIPLEDRTWKGDYNYAWNFKFDEDEIKEYPPKMGETTKEYNERLVDEGVYLF